MRPSSLWRWLASFVSTTPDKPPAAKPPTYLEADLVELGGYRILSCGSCRADLTDMDGCMSKAFTGRHGRAYLFSDVANVNAGPVLTRLLLTGVHGVRDVFCAGCGERMGWRYESCTDATQRYKLGCTVLEASKLRASWDE